MSEMWVVATVILVAGVVDDLRTRKVHNPLVLGALALALVSSIYFRGLDGSMSGALAFGLALVMAVPLFSLGVLGGGDVKLFAAFALCVEPVSAFWTLVYSLIWGALFGLTRAAVQRQLFALVRNTYKVSGRQRVSAQELHKIPFTFALLLGWFTQLTLLHTGGAI